MFTFPFKALMFPVQYPINLVKPHAWSVFNFCFMTLTLFPWVEICITKVYMVILHAPTGSVINQQSEDSRETWMWLWLKISLSHFICLQLDDGVSGVLPPQRVNSPMCIKGLNHQMLQKLSCLQKPIAFYGLHAAVFCCPKLSTSATPRIAQWTCAKKVKFVKLLCSTI